MSKIIICDGNSLLFRCFYATYVPDRPIMRAKDGTPTNAIYVFIKMIKKITSSLTPSDKVVVCFDTGHKSFRAKEDENYKAQRKPIEPELATQIPLAHELLDSMSIMHAEMEGFEGDDVAGSLAKFSQRKGDDVVLFTSDKDFLQLIDNKIEVHCLKKGLSDILVYTKENIKELYGCRADQVIDFKAIAGDSSDNYKGIPHVGEKSALKLLDQFDHLQDILDYYKGKDDSALARNINLGANDGLHCLEIATIKTDLNVENIYNEANYKNFDVDTYNSFLKKYNLESLMEKSKNTNNIKKTFSSLDYEEIKDISNGKKVEGIGIIFDGNNENTSPILGLGLINSDESLSFISAININSSHKLKELLESNEKLDCLDSKSLIVGLNRLGIKAKTFSFDFLLASYILDSDNSKSIESIFSNLSITLPNDPIEKIMFSLKYMSSNKKIMLEEINKQEALSLLTDVEIPLAETLAKIEIEGMPIDINVLKEIGEEYSKKISSIQQNIYDLAGEEFNIKSPKQVSYILFDKLMIPRAKKESGTSVEVLMSHYYDHPIIPLILEYRTYSKIIDGYIEALPRHIREDNKIHSVINQTLTSTGRLSMSEPNLQNISIRKEEGKEIRKAFFYEDNDYEFLSLDYSQIELRVLASLANIQNLIDVCNSGEDIHKATAAKVFNVPLQEVSEDMRRKAKTINFGIVYGISIYGLKQRLGISFEEAKVTIEQFKKSFEGLDEFENNQIQYARENGYVKTILNRRRYFPNINSTDIPLRKFSERAAVNAVIQGSAADLIKVAMNKIDKLLENKKTKMILQIHDELVFKIAKDEEKELIPQIINIMDNAIPLKVKLSVDGKTGKTWFDCK